MRKATDPIIKASGVEVLRHRGARPQERQHPGGGREVVVIVGPSGSGKSTFLRTLNQLETINDGHIWSTASASPSRATSTSCGKRWAWYSSPSTSSPPDGAGQHHPGAPEGAGTVSQGRRTGTEPRPAAQGRAVQQGPELPLPALRRPATAGGHRPGARHAAAHHAV